MKKFLPIPFLLLFLFPPFGGIKGGCQNPDIKRTMHWYFGYGAGLDFSSGGPVSDTNSRVLSSDEATYVMSDTCGDLLFYGATYTGEDKDTIFTRNHQVMANGVLLNGGYNPTQRISVQQPGNDCIYYIFYCNVVHSDLQRVGTFSYAIIDISNNNGLGEVISKDNVLMGDLNNPSSEKVTAIYHCNEKDIWIIGKPALEDKLYAWLLTDTGLVTTPVISQVVTIPVENGGGYMKFSPDGNLMAAVYMHDALIYQKDSTYIEIYNFDNCSGIFSNPVTIQFPYAYGISFSPDNTKLYTGVLLESFLVGDMDSIYLAQYDVSIYDQTSISNSKKIIFKSTSYAFDELQLGLDGKIYVCDLDTTSTNVEYGLTHLGVIHYPDSPGIACNYVPDEVDLQGRIHSAGLPGFPESYFRNFNYINCDSAFICSPTGISENNNLQKNNLIFDQLNGVIIINDFDNEISAIRIYNLLGKAVFETNYPNLDYINVNFLFSGIYFCSIYNKNDSIINLKFIKQ